MLVGREGQSHEVSHTHALHLALRSTRTSFTRNAMIPRSPSTTHRTFAWYVLSYLQIPRVIGMASVRKEDKNVVKKLCCGVNDQSSVFGCYIRYRKPQIGWVIGIARNGG